MWDKSLQRYNFDSNICWIITCMTIWRALCIDSYTFTLLFYETKSQSKWKHFQVEFGVVITPLERMALGLLCSTYHEFSEDTFDLFFQYDAFKSLGKQKWSTQLLLKLNQLAYWKNYPQFRRWWTTNATGSTARLVDILYDVTLNLQHFLLFLFFPLGLDNRSSLALRNL